MRRCQTKPSPAPASTSTRRSRIAPDALTAFPNVVLTPHIGGHTLESHVAMQDCVIANLEAFFAGKPLPYAVQGRSESVFGLTFGRVSRVRQLV